MISGIDLSAVRDFTLEKDKKNPTVWKIGALPSVVMASITGNITEKNSVERMIEIVRLGLRGWENFKIADKDVEFKSEPVDMFGARRDMMTLDLVNIIPVTAILEIGTHIINTNQLSVDEQKN